LSKNNLLILVLLFVFLSCSGTKKQNSYLATFKGGNISQNEYIEHYLKSTKYKPKKLPTVENLKKIVSQKALEKIAVQEATAQKLDQDSLYQNIMQSNERRLLSQKFVQTKIIPQVVTDSLITKFYKEFSPQYRMKYIMRPFLLESPKSFMHSQKAQIDKAYRELKNGEKFSKVVEKYSQDITTNKKGGDLGWMIRESMGDEALRKVFDTLSQFTYSKPFKGYGGYYILYKGEKREVKVPPLKSIKQKIWKTLYHSRLAFVNKTIEDKFSELSKKYNYKTDERAIKQILDKLNKYSKDNTDASYSDLLNGFTDKKKQTILATYANGVITVKELFVDRKRAPTNKQEFLERLKNIAKQHLFAKYAKETGLLNEPELKEQLTQMKTSLLRTILYQNMVKNKVNKVLNEKGTLKGEAKIREKTKIENSLRTKFENDLKSKYNFKFIKQNFDDALKKALKKKKFMNAKK